MAPPRLHLIVLSFIYILKIRVPNTAGGGKARSLIIKGTRISCSTSDKRPGLVPDVVSDVPWISSSHPAAPVVPVPHSHCEKDDLICLNTYYFEWYINLLGTN